MRIIGLMQDPFAVVQAARVEELLLRLIDNQMLVMMLNPRDQLQALEEAPNLKAFAANVELIKCPSLQVNSITELKSTVNSLKRMNGLQSRNSTLYSIMKNKNRLSQGNKRDAD